MSGGIIQGRTCVEVLHGHVTVICLVIDEQGVVVDSSNDPSGNGGAERTVEVDIGDRVGRAGNVVRWRGRCRGDQGAVG